LSYRNQQLSGWGRYPASRAAIARPERRFEVAEAFRPIQNTATGVIARGSGLAYGDAALNAGGRIVSMVCLNRFFAFDRESGHISCEAGVTLREVLEVCVPQGWFLAVTPGTASATIGGCLACDVHGKNHHLVGSFSQHVVGATVLTANGEMVICGPDRQADLFWATAGGMGLTGIILDVTLRLQRIETAFVLAQNIVTRDLEETFRRIEDTGTATYSVAWLDGVVRGARLGRGVIMLGEHATLTDLPAESRAAPLAMSGRRARSLPFGLPSGVLGRPLALACNEMIYRRYAAGTGTKPMLVGANKYFYPLDALDNWNRLYGRRGFLEYQIVLPPARAFDTVRQMLEMLDRAGAASFFTSLKRLGENSAGHISFPMPGYAFSFTVPAGDECMMSLLDRCDEVTLAAGGRVYLAKDARLGAQIFAGMYPRHGDWLKIVRRYDAAGLFASDMSRRLGLTLHE
jgi:decaprenylphospho-beta-D-ribofuranose 2-oxidase